MKLIKLQGWWNDDKRQEALDMGLEPPKTYKLSTIFVNPDRIAYLDEYEGFICICFSAYKEDCIVTNIPSNQVEVFGEIINPKIK